MPNTLEGLAVIVGALLPGALFTWSYEQQIGRSGSQVADRVLRLLGASLVLLAIYAWPLYEGYRRFIITRDVEDGRPLPWWLWPAVVAFAVLPWLLGGLAGSGVRNRQRWSRILTGPAPAPRAWDHLFSTPNLVGWVRLRLKNGVWIWGAWAEEVTEGSVDLRSYAAGYPEPQDLYFSDTAEVDEDGLPYMVDGKPLMRGVGVLVRWDEVCYLEYVEG